MKLIGFQVKNYRSIVGSGELRLEALQSFVGENNSGKSNLLNAIQVFLTPGAGGVNDSDFFNKVDPIILTATFSNLSQERRRRLLPYLLGDKLILEKHIKLEEDRRSGKIRPKAEYHGYKAKPKDWWLSTDGVLEHENRTRPDWKKIATEHGILDYVKDEKGGVNKASYETGIRNIILEREDVEFEEPHLGDTQALGLQPVLLDELPIFRLLPAITDYSSEIDKRASQTNFRLLMGDLADRILRSDPRYKEIEDNINALTCLLNAPKEDEEREEGRERLEVLTSIEEKLKDIISRLMPSVQGVRMQIEIGEIKEIFSKGVSMLVDDGVFTEVMMKGHGLQRCVVFGLLQALILNQRGQLIDIDNGQDEQAENNQTLILGIEEPELYIHPQMQRLVFSVLKDFASTDQVVYSTHAPSFVDVSKYETIAVTRKQTVEEGTKFKQCPQGILDADTDRKTFQFFSSFGLEQNMMFFSNKVILVEGQEDIIAVLATGRNLGLFREFPEEIGFTLVPTGSKQELPKYMKLLNGFGIPYVVLHELDGDPDSDDNMKIKDLLGENKTVELPNKLEDLVEHAGHFSKPYFTMQFFREPNNINQGIKDKVSELFS